MLQRARVLLADDDLSVRSGVEDLLSPLGLEIVRAEDGTEALEIARAQLPDLHLLLFDLHMPGLTGLDVFTRLREELETRLRAEAAAPCLRLPPCILYSAEASVELQSRAIALGAFSFLKKPVVPTALRGEVLRALASAG
jgi:CheY-like chemotaxis protein